MAGVKRSEISLIQYAILFSYNELIEINFRGRLTQKKVEKYVCI